MYLAVLFDLYSPGMVGGFLDIGRRLGVGPAQIVNGYGTGNNYELATGVANTIGSVSERVLILAGGGRGLKLKGCFEGDTDVTLHDGTRVPIGDVLLGDRVSTYDGGCDTQVTSDWRMVELVAENPEYRTEVLRIELLQPPAWFAANDVQGYGDQVWLNVEEIGVSEPATVIGVHNFGGVEPGCGRVVTGVFTHINDVHDVEFSEGDVPLRVTGAHQLFSLTKERWTQVQYLVSDEELQTSGGYVTVASVSDETERTRVYNLTIETAHEYLVGPDEIRAHNGVATGCGGHSTPWAQMSGAQRKAFQHSYSRHGAELGLPNWSQANAANLQTRFNSVVGHIRSNGTQVPGVRKPHNGVGVDVNFFEATIHGTKYYYYETLDRIFISAGLAR